MNCYKELANAIVMQAVSDYRLHSGRLELSGIEDFFRSGWFNTLTDVNPEILISRLRKEKANHER